MSPTRRNCLAGMAALCLGTCLATPGTARAVTIHDDQGELTIDTPPARIVALEYSFVDALANVGISPVGIADDGQPDRIQEPMRSLIKPWTSVGTRSQPSMEVIAGLKPDLIIADTSRHRAVYDQLRKIAPVLLLNRSEERRVGKERRAKWSMYLHQYECQPKSTTECAI